MLICVGPGSVDVVEREVLTALAVVTSLPREDAVRAVIADGLARLHGDGSDGHVWLDVAELARRAAPDDDAAWREGFAAMIRYASDLGWTDEDGTLVRAHVERAGT